jgi:hypothetical protein
MFLFRKPSLPAIRAFLDSQAKLDFSYTAVGASAHEPPPDDVVDHTRVKLGAGSSTFARPNQLLDQLGSPLVRRLQKRFARDSAAAMARAIGKGF